MSDVIQPREVSRVLLVVPCIGVPERLLIQ